MKNRKTILLIEDNPALLENTSEILELENYNVLATQCGKMGISLINKHKPDLIICDTVKRDFNGFQVLKSIKSTSKTRLIPFIFLSAHSEIENIMEGYDNGADVYITKPFEIDEFLKIICFCLTFNPKY